MTEVPQGPATGVLREAGMVHEERWQEIQQLAAAHVTVSEIARMARCTRSSLSYASRRDPLTALRQRLRELAQTRVCFGYRRLRVLLLREGWDVGKERFYRVCTEEGLALRRKRPWRHATAVHREQRRPATERNDTWSTNASGSEH